MESTVQHYLNSLKKNHARQRKAAAMLVCLSLLVAVGTGWALHIPGESRSAKTYCGFEEHQHSEECVEKVLVCGHEETEASCDEPMHIHDESCYAIEQTLICGYEETDDDSSEEKHIHGESCYATEQILICGYDDAETDTTESEHIHTDECYELRYICGYDQEHTHTHSCYSNPEADVETSENWERTVADIELTGDFAADLIAVAKTQLGYTQSSDNYRVITDEEGNETEQVNGYTRYGAWFGEPYEEWSAMFVSFCLNYSGITRDIMPYNASCSGWITDLLALGFYEPAFITVSDEAGNAGTLPSGYTPESGDIVFFDTDNDGISDHMGIAEELQIEEKINEAGVIRHEYTVHTIEGNCCGRVAKQEYSLDDETIMGFGSLYSAYLYALDNGFIENGSFIRLTSEAEDGAVFSVIGELPESAELSVSALSQEQINYIGENIASVSISEGGTFAYDVKILLNGEKYTPENDVYISVSGLGIAPYLTVSGCHLIDVDADTLADIDKNDVNTEPVGVINTGNRISYTAHGFSVIVLSVEDESDTAEFEIEYVEEEIILADDEIFVIDDEPMAMSDDPGETITTIRQLKNIKTTLLDGRTFIITSYSAKYVITPEVYNVSGNKGLVGKTDLSISDAIWTFEAPEGSEGGSEYYIKNQTGEYLKIANLENVKTTSNNVGYVVYAANKDDATVFYAELPTGDVEHVYLYALSPYNIKCYFNAKGGEDNFSRFSASTANDNGSKLRLYYTHSYTPGSYDVYSMYLGLYKAEYNSAETSINKIHYKTVSSTVYDAVNPIPDAKKYIDADEYTSYLIPVSYAEAAFGFVFDPLNKDNYPIAYVPDADNNENDLSKAAKAVEYLEIDGVWYIRVEDIGSYTGDDADIPRTNIYYINIEEATDTVSPSSTVINMFDFWTTSDRIVTNDKTSLNYNFGINYNHALKFCDGASGYGIANKSEDGPTQGIVENKLGADGYPQLSDRANVPSNNESLRYIFDPTVTHDGKISFPNVQNLLSVDSDGYFYYNCHERFASFNEETNSFTVYTTPAVSRRPSTGRYGQFFPFNTIAEAALNNDSSDYMNHYFGISMTTRFLQQNDGYTTVAKTTPTTFEFSGDDDAWIFIDNVLVADLGGIHGESGVKINFATGDVTITDINNKVILSSTLKALFEAAGVSTDNANWSGNTFASNANEHTLKFFYLERGNCGSNLMLKFNLSEVPATAIYKVDQYGEPLAGATFAVYASNVNGEYYNEGTKVTLPENYHYNLDPLSSSYGSILDGSENVLVPALYVGTTDSTGTMYFTDNDGMNYSLTELQAMFGDYFLLEEIIVPDGYRSVSDNVLLCIEDSLLQTAESSYNSGVWSSPNALVTATNTLYVANPSDYSKVGADVDGAVVYYTPSSTGSSSEGSLFAVVLAKKDKDDEAFDTWSPVYGNDVSGYKYMESESSTVSNAIAAAKIYGTSHVFNFSASGMQALLEELPGDPKLYYTYLYENDKSNTGNAEYLVAYYYTTEDILKDGWENVTEYNTARVTSHGLTAAAEDSFKTQWGATIMVPNVENRLFVQKNDAKGNMVNGAVFALYQAGEDGSKNMYYIASDNTHIYLGEADAENKGTAGLSYGSDAGTYTIAENGEITVVIGANNYTIEPVDMATTTASDNYVNEDGTGYFFRLSYGYYVVREVKAPDGYELNTAETKVLVNNDAVYANAGTKDNGVAVGNGVGYLVSTLDTFATEGSIDETLTWIYSVLRVNESTGFSDFNLGNAPNYVKKLNDTEAPGYGSDNTANMSQAMVTYLVFDPESDNSLFDYRVALTQDARIPGNPVTYTDFNGFTRTVNFADAALDDIHGQTLQGEGTLRLYTDVGWTALEVYQDYLLGKALTEGYTNYTNLHTSGIHNISNLFSNSTFILVTDNSITADLKVTEVDGIDSTVLGGSSFVLYSEDTYVDVNGIEQTTKLYYTHSAEDGTSWKALSGGETESDYKLTTVADPAHPIEFLSLTNGIYHLKEIIPPDTYASLTYEIILTVKNGVITMVRSDGADIPVSSPLKLKRSEEDGDENVYLLTVPAYRGYELPETGGAGTAVFTLSGLLLMTVSLVSMCPLRRRHIKTHG